MTTATTKQQASRLLHRFNWRFLDFSYLRKWTIIGILIGIVAGVGSVIFFLAIEYFTNIFLGLGSGFYPPLPGGEGGNPVYSLFIARPWAIPLITAGGGLLAGFIVYSFAPEAEGHGTDAAIFAFHKRGGEIRGRIPIVKTIASAITLGSGGSGGREGPTAQIAAGFGSILGRVFKLSVKDRRIAVAVGIGAGIGSIFKAPLGGALLSTEILYHKDFEVEALLPSLISSVVGYSIFGFVFGWSPIFTIPVSGVVYQNPISLLLYAVVGLVCAPVGILYVKSFYGIRSVFIKLNHNIPNFVRPAIGGVIVGIIAIGFPQVLGLGYGWLQFAISGNYTLLPLWILFVLIFLKIFATSFTIGSGGSAGVFGPGMVIGGFVGAFVGGLFHSFGLFTYVNIASIVVVGMVAFFGGVSKAPLSIIVMGSEMTGGYTLLAPMMLATFISYTLSGEKNTIYREQVSTRQDSPAHKTEFQVPVLRKLLVRDAMNSSSYNKVEENATIEEALRGMQQSDSRMVSVVNNDGNLVGVVYLSDLLGIPLETRLKTTVGSVMDKDPEVVQPSDSLHRALEKLSESKSLEIPVVSSEDGKRIIGSISVPQIIRLYDLEIKSMLEEKTS